MSPSIDLIARATAQACGVTFADMMGRRRPHRLVRPRQSAMWLAVRLTPHSYTEIGLQLRRDRTTVQHGVHTIETQRRRDARLAKWLDGLAEQLRALAEAELPDASEPRRPDRPDMGERQEIAALVAAVGRFFAADGILDQRKAIGALQLAYEAATAGQRPAAFIPHPITRGDEHAD